MVLINSNFDPNVQIVQTDQGRWIILNVLMQIVLNRYGLLTYTVQIMMIQASLKIYIRIYQPDTDTRLYYYGGGFSQDLKYLYGLERKSHYKLSPSGT